MIKGFEQCLAFEKKFIKKENILFPILETKVPSTKPLEVMWSLHDDARTQLKEIIRLFSMNTVPLKTLKELIGSYYYLVYGIIQKERLILLPVAADFLSEDELDTMYEESFQYGYALIEKNPLEKNKTMEHGFIQGVFKVKNGILDFKQLNLVLNHLPLDITFVDKDDRVRYFNVTNKRHFPRNPSIIGRDVEHCHPPKSVDIVKRIVSDFKAQKRDFAEFWITYKERFLYITYHVIFDETNTYQGILEVSQDITHQRTLKGEKRLLNWEL